MLILSYGICVLHCEKRGVVLPSALRGKGYLWLVLFADLQRSIRRAFFRINDVNQFMQFHHYLHLYPIKKCMFAPFMLSSFACIINHTQHQAVYGYWSICVMVYSVVQPYVTPSDNHIINLSSFQAQYSHWLWLLSLSIRRSRRNTRLRLNSIVFFLRARLLTLICPLTVIHQMQAPCPLCLSLSLLILM